jgi:hypothetical protein
MSNVAATHHSDDAAAANAAKVAQRTTIVLGKDVGQLRQSQCVHAGLVVQEFGYSAVVGLGAIAAIALALWLIAPRPSGRPMASGTGCKSCIPVRAENWME